MREETKNHLIKKNIRYYYDVSNDLYTIPVPVIEWKDNQLAHDCPFCHTHYKLNGTPYKRCYFKIHKYGNNGKDSDGNYGVRTPHCDIITKLYWGLDEINYEFKLIGANMIY